MNYDRHNTRRFSTVEIEGHNVRITAQLDRKLYLAVNKVLDRIGGKWNRMANSALFNSRSIQRGMDGGL